MFFLFNYLKLSLWSVIYYYNRSDLILDIIVKNINDCGCLAIKFTQWILPKIELIYDLDPKKDKWFGELEHFYEYNNIHDLKYTEDTYKNDFGENIYEYYELGDIIGSGSIGQVYKARNKQLNEYHAIKIVHPNMDGQILFVKYVLFILMKTPIIKDYFSTILPFNLYDFIIDFQNQTSMVHDANNCLRFYEIYKTDKFIVIPSLIKVSNNILIMSYEDGERFDDLQVSDYIKYKSILLLNIFLKNNQSIYNFNHGDIHKGNWKVRVKDHNPYLVVYDFGFCWKIYEKDKEMMEFIDDTFIKVDNDYQYKDDFFKICSFLLSEKCSKEIILDELDKTNVKIDADSLFKMIINIAGKERIVLDSVLLQILICLTQYSKYLQQYSLLRPNSDGLNPGFLGYEYYRKRLIDIKSFCEANNLVENYVTYIDKKIKKYNPDINDLFETIETENNFENLSFLKKLALS